MNEFRQALFARPDAAARRAHKVPIVLLGAIYVAAYVFLERISDSEQPFVNYSWNPNTGTSLAFVLIFGPRMIPFMFIAPLLDELVDDLLFRQIPQRWYFELSMAALIGCVYSVAALFLLHPKTRFDLALQSMRSLFLLTATSAVSAALVAAGYAAIAVAAGTLPATDYTLAALSYWVGDFIGIMVMTPFMLVLWTGSAAWILVETLLPLAVLLTTLVLVHFPWTPQHLQFSYLLFVPVVWMAVRNGIEGACLGILVLEVGFLFGFYIFPDEMPEMPKIQALLIVLALTGLFAGELVTERRRTEGALRLHQESLVRVGRLDTMGELAAAIAHEMNQPLSAAGTYARLVADALRTGDDHPDSLAGTAIKAAAQVERASEVMKRLRALVQHGYSNVIACQVDRLIQETTDLCRPSLDRAGVTIRQSVAVGLPPVMADVLQVEQVLFNLIRNSIEAIGDVGQGTISIEAGFADADFVEVRVRDSGPGFPPDRVANPFLPLSSTKKEGLGVGLSLSRSLIEAHGGRIWLGVNSPGAAVHFTLPVANSLVRSSDRRDG